MTLTHNPVEAISRGFINYLNKTGQLALLPELARRYLRQSQIQFDPHIAKVQAAIALTPAQVKQLNHILSQLFHRPITVITQVRTDLIGGMFIQVGDKVIDLSLKTKLDTLEESLTH